MEGEREKETNTKNQIETMKQILVFLYAFDPYSQSWEKSKLFSTDGERKRERKKETRKASPH